MNKNPSANKTPEFSLQSGDLGRRQFLAQVSVVGLGALALGFPAAAAVPAREPSRAPVASVTPEDLDFLPDPGWCEDPG